jgi:hypothetical protein
MKILSLDPKRTHERNPSCPMRLVQVPDGRSWMCLDCVLYILMTNVEVSPNEPEEPMSAETRAGDGDDQAR